MSDFNVRDATRDDLEAILGLVQGLADFENEPDAVTATLDDYHKAFDNNVFSCIVACDKDGA